MPVMFIQTKDQKEQDQEAIQQKHLRQGYLANWRLVKGQSLYVASKCTHHYKMCGNVCWLLLYKDNHVIHTV